MAFIYNGVPLTGTPDNDFIIDHPNNGADNELIGHAGNDLMMADWDFFFSSFENQFGTTVATAFNITAFATVWSTYENSEILNSTTVPHTSILFSGASAPQAYWSVTAGAGATITIDVDFGDATGSAETDTVVELYAADGVTLLAMSDDVFSDPGGDGSVPGLFAFPDSFLQYTFATAGTYIIKLKEFDGAFEADDDFVLNVSLTGQAVTNTDPVSGDDVLFGGQGQDILSGGGGNDTFIIEFYDEVVDNEYYNGGTGMDTLMGLDFNNFTTVVLRSIESIIYSDEVLPVLVRNANFLASQIGGGNIASDASIAFSGLANVADLLTIIMDVGSLDLSGLNFLLVDPVNDGVVIDGGAGGDTIVGSDIRDDIEGGAGNDNLNGGLGADMLFGGDDNDSYVVDADDVVDETGSTGIDTIYGAVTMSLIDAARFKGNIENVTLLGAANLNATGNNLANVLIGNSGNNTLNGNFGADTMQGRDGNDLYGVHDATDVVDESGFGGVDTVNAVVTVSLADAVHFKGNIENVTLLGTANINATGNALANVLTGNAGANTLDGGAGADTMRGLAGNDLYGVREITDIVDESVAGSAGIDRVNSLVSFSLVQVSGAALGKGAIEAVTLLGTTNALIYGNGFANVFTGNTGSNLLAAGAGNDTLTGAGGNDFFLFNTKLNASTNVDTVTDMNEAGDDTILLENAVFTTLSPGALPVDFFRISTTGAVDANDQVIYDNVTGELFYDANGNAAGGSVLFAQLDAGLALTAADFFVA